MYVCMIVTYKLLLEFSKGGEQITKVGGSDLWLCTVTTVRLWVYDHSPPWGVWGHAPPENFGDFDSENVSDAFWQQFLDWFSSKFYSSTLLQTSTIMTELCCCTFVVWACDKMGGSAPLVSKVGGLKPPLPPLFLRPCPISDALESSIGCGISLSNFSDGNGTAVSIDCSF